MINCLPQTGKQCIRCHPPFAINHEYGDQLGHQQVNMFNNDAQPTRTLI